MYVKANDTKLLLNIHFRGECLTHQNHSNIVHLFNYI